MEMGRTLSNIEIAKGKAMSPDVADELARSKSWAIRQTLAMNKNCPPSALRIIFERGDDGDIMELADNPQLPEDLQHAIANSSWASIRYQLAGNASLVNAVREKLKTDSSVHVAARAFEIGVS